MITLILSLIPFTVGVYREGAYVDALSVAAITHTIAKACGAGLLKSCSCDDDAVDFPESNEVEYEQGCSDNVDYGLHVAERFLNKRFTSIGRDLKHELAQHNFRAAKEVGVGIIVLCWAKLQVQVSSAKLNIAELYMPIIPTEISSNMVPIRNTLVILTIIRGNMPKNGACMKTFVSLKSARHWPPASQCIVINQPLVCNDVIEGRIIPSNAIITRICYL